MNAASGHEVYSVLMHRNPIGLLRRDGNNTRFEFTDAYLNDAQRPVLGQAFEDNPRGFWSQAMRVPAWFSNLLPESDSALRVFLAGQFDVSPQSEMKLLASLGADDLPGAVNVVELDDSGNEQPASFRSEMPSVEPEHGSVAGLRFSVAGVQLKLSMLKDSNTLRLRGAGEMATTYVKFPGTTPRVPENEYTMMRLAKRCGIDVPEVGLVPGEQLGPLPSHFDQVRRENVYWIQRFDRTEAGMVHIEDLNQVVRNWPEDKYKQVGYEKLGHLIAVLCGPEDFEEFLRRLVFNIAIGNEDDHLKNWSLIYPDQRRPRLSPAYDLVSTVTIPGLDRGLALKLGGDRRIAGLTRDRLARVCQTAGQDSGSLDAAIERVFQGLSEAEPDFRSEGLLPIEFWTDLVSYRRSVDLLKPMA